jgi:hypothetical protein
MTLRDRTVMPQHGPTTRSIAVPGGASNVVRIGIWWRDMAFIGKRVLLGAGAR